MALFDLAHLLHKTVGELETMTVDEFRDWIAWSRIRGTSDS